MHKNLRRGLFLASTILGLAAGPALAVPYAYVGNIPIPSSPDNTAVSNAGGKFQTYDIADTNAATNLVYLADRSNASVDIFNAQTLTYVGRIGGNGTFGGQQASNGISGPDGVVVAGNSLFVGNGSPNSNTAAVNANSTLYGFTLSSNPATQSSTPTVTTHTGGTGRVDELAFDPSRNRVITVNNADSPPFVTFVDATTGAIQQKIVFDGTGGTPNATAGGLEAPTYDPVTGKYYIAVPQIGTSGPGALAEVDPATGAVTRVFDLSTVLGANGVCSPTGTVASSSGKVLIGCGATNATQTILIDPTQSGVGANTMKVVNGIGGEDEVAYNSNLDTFYTASRFQPGGPVLGIIDGNGNLLQTLATTPQDHSVTVDPNNGDVFVAAGGIAGNTVCPNGCELVYAPVPEPPSALTVVAGLLGLIGLARYGVRRAG